ncbi:MAG: hypothetical protein ACLTOV_10720 [Phocaeicola sp.]
MPEYFKNPTELSAMSETLNIKSSPTQYISHFILVDVEVSLQDHKLHDIGALEKAMVLLFIKHLKKLSMNFAKEQHSYAGTTLFITMPNICLQNNPFHGRW